MAKTKIPTKSIQKKISEKIGHFDILALLALLEYLGYASEEILFQSYLTNASRRGLIEKIEFQSHPFRLVTIYFNMGLLSVHTPLPSYFMKVLEDDNLEEESFVNFMGYFDHKLIQNYLQSIYPERNLALYGDWEKTKGTYLKLVNLNSASTLHWMLELIFPELGIFVAPNPYGHEILGEGMQIGKTVLGDSIVLGARSRVAVLGLEIRLHSPEEYTDVDTSWADEIRNRLDSLLFPILCERGNYLQIFLIIESQKTWAKLQKESYLGVDRIRGGREQPRQVLIFKGQVVSG